MSSYHRVAGPLWDGARMRTLKEIPSTQTDVVYWMARDQRINDNWALLYAQQLAGERDGLVRVVFCLDGAGLAKTKRHADFMVRGLREVHAECDRLNIEFAVLENAAALRDWAKDARCVVCDFTPLREGRLLRDALAENISVYEVDAHNVVPVWQASEKREVGARTLRPKIHAHLDRFLTEFPTVKKQKKRSLPVIDWAKIEATLDVDLAVEPIDWCVPGEASAHEALATFLNERLDRYSADRNNPTLDATSNLSPYFHFGHLAPQRAILEAQRRSKENPKTQDGAKAFIEEALVRRELADNFCFYEPAYDSIACAAQWARDSLDLHKSDPRDYLYTRSQLEAGASHEDIWNAAQRQLMTTGKMHGFMRMYWCKKILEWSPTPEDALATALYLNDKYSIDGSDPNGFVGVAWSICGIHDMGWKERPIFGKIRFMNYAGCKRKFNVRAYAQRWLDDLDDDDEPKSKKKKTAHK